MQLVAARNPQLDQKLPDESALIEVVRNALDVARTSGATAAAASVGVSTALTVQVRKGEVETVEFQDDRDLGVTVYFGKRKAHASTADFAATAVAETVEMACSMARHMAEDPWSGLADADRMASEFPDLGLDHPWPLEVDQAIELARRSESAAFDYDSRIHNSDGASLDTRRGVSVYANSHGFVGCKRGTEHSLSCVVLAKDEKTGAMQRDYWYDNVRLPQNLADPESIGRQAAQRTVARLGAREFTTCQAPVLFPAELARGLIGSFIGAISGGALYRKASFLLNKLGEPVFADHVRIHQQPLLPGGMGSASFDREGVTTQTRDLITGGVLQGYVLGSYSARRLGLESTGNAGGVYNLIVEPGELDRSGMLQEMGTGLLVTELMGSGGSTVTGDYSRGGSGFWVENGVIAYPVENITIAGNLKDMYRGIVAVGNDVDMRGNIRSGSILVDRMTIAGQG